MLRDDGPGWGLAADGRRHYGGVRISARAEYAVRASLILAAAAPESRTAEALAEEQGLPRKFLETILTDLRRSGLIMSQRGPEGGHRLARPATEVSIAEILRAVDGPLADVRGGRPESAIYTGAAVHLQEVWVATRAAVRKVLDEVTLADVVSGSLPPHVKELLASPEAWTTVK